MSSGPGARQHLLQRLLSKDATLWSHDEEVVSKIAQRLGWLDAVRFSRAQLPLLWEFVQQTIADGFDQVVLLGMGGSSLAAEVFQQSFAQSNQPIRQIVLDTTFPDIIDQVTTTVSASTPLFIVSSKSGTTAETMALREHFWQWCRGRYGDDAGSHFIAITDEGSALHQLAADHAYRSVFLNPADIGGRYSALSHFGLVPACLLGVDLEKLLARASEVLAPGDRADLAVQLGEFIGHAVLGGRDKLTLEFSPELQSMQAWVEQLVSESTGKDATGVITVLNEPFSSAERYGDDRIFVSAHLKHDKTAIGAWQKKRGDLERLGHPCWSIELADNYDLGAEFVRWQIATSISASIIGVNPFDEPDVNASKDATREILLEAPPDSAERSRQTAPQTDAKALARFIVGIGAPDYIALLAYLPTSKMWRDALENLRARIAQSSTAATILSFGPRYLHSSGQIHKGGGKNGHFLVLTAGARRDLPIPGRQYGFQHLIDAQAQGDIEVLKNRGQQVLHIELGPVDEAAATLARLSASLE